MNSGKKMKNRALTQSEEGGRKLQSRVTISRVSPAFRSAVPADAGAFVTELPTRPRPPTCDRRRRALPLV